MDIKSWRLWGVLESCLYLFLIFFFRINIILSLSYESCEAQILGVVFMMHEPLSMNCVLRHARFYIRSYNHDIVLVQVSEKLLVDYVPLCLNSTRHPVEGNQQISSFNQLTTQSRTCVLWAQ